MALTEKQKEDIAARKAINEAKRNKKPATKQPKKAVEDTKVLAEQIEAENPTTQTEITPEVVAKATVAMDELVALDQEIDDKLIVTITPFEPEPLTNEALLRGVEKMRAALTQPLPESITDVLEQEATNVLPEEENVPTDSVEGLESIKEGQFRVTSEELSEIASKGTELLLNATPEQLVEYGKHGEHAEIEPDCSIDFTNGRSKPAVYTQIGGYNTQEGTYFDKMMREIVYILTLGGKFDRATAPRFSQLPFSCKMKVPLEKYMDYVNRVGYPDYESDGEYYRTTMSAPDFRVLLNFLEQRVGQGYEIDPKQACMNKSRYVVPIRTRFPIENTAGLHTRVREPIKYSVEELRSMEWDNVKRIAALHGITDTNHNSVISQLKDIFEEKVDD